MTTSSETGRFGARHVAVCFIALCGCEWFGEDARCKEGTTSCDGDRVRECAADLERSTSAGEPIFTWRTDLTCKDDPQLGKFTCGVVRGRATCVPEGKAEETGDAGSRSDTADSWLRVDVVREGPTLRIERVTSFSLGVRPRDPAWGMAAVVSYRGTDIIDASLAPFVSDASTRTSAWIRAETADRIALLASDGAVLSTAAAGAASIHASLSSTQTPTAALPATARVVAWREGRESAPSLQELNVLRRAMADVPSELVLVVPEIVLDAEGARRRGSVAARDPIDGRLWVDFSSEHVRAYDRDTSALSFAIVRALGETYVAFSELVAVRDQQTVFRPKLPADFPKELEPHLRDQHAPLLASGETVVGAWRSLHKAAAAAKLASPYRVDIGPAPRDHAEAVAFGFASLEGAQDAQSDLVEYLAHAQVPSLWTHGPCASIRATPLDATPPATMVHVTKLLALRGIGLLAADKLQACAGDLRMASEKDGIVLHKPNGERIAFTDHLEGIRQPYFGNEVQLSWKAERLYVSPSLSAGYRGEMPTVMRLSSTPGNDGKDFREESDTGAIFAMTNPDGYRTTVAVGGLLAVTKVRPDGLEAYALMVVLDREQLGTKLFPLISAQVRKPVWGDAP